MTAISADFETGTNSNTIGTGDTGSHTAWDAVQTGGSGVRIYDNSHVAHGSLAAKLSTSTSGVTYLEWSTAFGSQTEHWGRLYVYMTANPPSAQHIVDVETSGSAGAAALQITTAGKIQCLDSAGTSRAVTTAAITLNQWTRIEWHMIHSATVGQVEVKLFNTTESTTATETQTTTAAWNTTAAAAQIYFGNRSTAMASLGPFWLDNIVAAATAYPGPFVANTVAPAATGSSTIGSVVSTDNGTWNITPSGYTYQWQRDVLGNSSYSNIGGATSSTYTLVLGDDLCNVRCVVTATGPVSNETATANSNSILDTSGGSSSTIAPGFRFGFR